MHRLVFGLSRVERRPPPRFLPITQALWSAMVAPRMIRSCRCSRILGKIVRFGPNRISFNNASALEEIYGFKANTQKSSFYKVFEVFFKVPGSMSTINKKEHKLKRRIVSQALTAAAIKSMETHIIDGVRVFCKNLSNETSVSTEIAQGWSSLQNMTDSFGRLTFDIIGDLCFGQKWNVTNSGRNRKFVEIIPDGVAGLLLVRRRFLIAASRHEGL